MEKLRLVVGVGSVLDEPTNAMNFFDWVNLYVKLIFDGLTIVIKEEIRESRNSIWDEGYSP